ncbi:MAG: PSD1 domain-containing protein [Pirellulales bacterium]|nr:PSD1 domain-containing protein [Pirellulales bacterium]
MVHRGIQSICFLLRGLLPALAAVLCSPESVANGRDDPASLEFFESRIRPVLLEHCHECHAADEVNGGLRVDSGPALLAGGDSGPAVAPGKPEESLLLAALRHDGFEMPPSGRLPDAVVADFAAWIEAGAVDPRTDQAALPRAAGIDIEAGRAHWAFQPIARPLTPEVADNAWPHNEIDAFVLAALEAAGHQPAPDAQRLTWLRRVTFDLTGLPPTPEALDAFLADSSSEAEATVVERLLASPQFGERMARHWLDIARFAESSGGGRSMVFQEAWRYRDYVIEAFNADMPFDQFLTEQIAGDLLPAAGPEEEARQLTATGYLVLGAINYEEQDKRHLEMDVVDEQLETLGRGLLGMTLGCARCHDHKFDPIPTDDYYALAGILRSTKTLKHSNVSSWTESPLPMPPGLAAEVAVPHAMAAKDAETVVDCEICIRGDVHNKGRTVPRGVLQVATLGPAPTMPAAASGRRELAAWLTDPEHPLTSRVFVNRLWQQFFGRGLVATPDNFGTTASPPSHPALLDHLARRLTDGDWSTKNVVRAIALSHTYRQACRRSPPLEEDPDNALLAGLHRRRLDAESLRDAMLSVAGTLVSDLGGPGISDPKVLANAGSETPSEYTFVFTDTRRSIYTPAFRNRRLELFEVFDAANPNAVVGRRPVSTVAPQALYLLNSPFVMEQASAAATRLLAEPLGDPAAGVDRAFRQTLGRGPTAREHELVLAAVAGSGPDAIAAWATVYQSLFGCIDFRTLE